MSEFSMEGPHAVNMAEELMTGFAARTGLVSDAPPARYLWTDAFAVWNFLALARATGDEKYPGLARDLVTQVHETLGRHREDDDRTGWISGLSAAQGKEHPTRGGLRIGKPLPERPPGEPFDSRTEWDRDGQYFHYLTRWMQALDAMARQTREPRYVRWALELAEAAAQAFVYQNPAGGFQMYWKMSIDLSRPLVPSMGHHDPLDGYITLLRLRTTVKDLKPGEPQIPSDPELNLEEALGVFAGMIQGRDWTTDDPLGLGGLLMDAAQLTRLVHRGGGAGTELLRTILRAAQTGLGLWADSGALLQPAEHRLGFRELGLAIGLEGVAWIGANIPSDSGLQKALSELRPHISAAEEIVSFWMEGRNRQTRTWTAHRDINEVMLATSLLSRI